VDFDRGAAASHKESADDGRQGAQQRAAKMPSDASLVKA
jgi:hypothetical protein